MSVTSSRSSTNKTIKCASGWLVATLRANLEAAVFPARGATTSALTFSNGHEKIDNRLAIAPAASRGGGAPPGKAASGYQTRA